MSNKTNNLLAIAGIISSLAAYQLWRLLWDDFCYQALGIALLFLFALGYNLGKQIFWVRKSCLIGVFISMYNLFDEWFLRPLHCYGTEYFNFAGVVFFIFLPEIQLFLAYIKTILLDWFWKVQLNNALKTLVNVPKNHNRAIRQYEKQKRWLGRFIGAAYSFNFMLHCSNQRKPARQGSSQNGRKGSSPDTNGRTTERSEG